MRTPSRPAPRLLVPLALLAFLALCAAPAAAQRVHVVDATGGAGSGFAEIADAVAGAAPGDVVLVRPGTYASFTVTRGITVQAEPGAVVEIEGPTGIGQIAISSLPADEAVVLRGIDALVGSTGAFTNPALLVADCDGPVLVEECDFASSPIGHPAGSDGEAVRVVDSASVTLVRCSLQGEALLSPAPDAIVCGSDVQAFDCSGGGLVAGGGRLFLAGGSAPDVTVGGDPFASIVCSQGDGRLVLLDVAPAVNVVSGSSETVAGAARGYAVTSPAREGETVVESYAAPAGEVAVLVFAAEFLPHVDAFELLGTLHLAPPGFAQLRGVVGPTGVLQASLTVPDLDPGVAGLVLAEQAVFVDPATLDVAVSNPASLLLLDAAL